MSELTDRLPGEVIFAAYSNEIRDRAAQRYVDGSARDASVPFPEIGEMAYLTGAGGLKLTIYNGDRWQSVLTDDGGTMTGRLNGLGGGTVTDMNALAVSGVGEISAGDRVGVRGYMRYVDDSDVFELRGNDGAADGAWFQMHTDPTGDEAGIEMFDPFGPGRFKFKQGTDELLLRQGASSFVIRSQNNVGTTQRLDIQGQQLVLTPDSGGTVLINVPTDDNNNQRTVRNIYFGTGVPAGALGFDGDVFIRHL